jgi:Flp pilus assembly protein TadB
VAVIAGDDHVDSVAVRGHGVVVVVSVVVVVVVVVSVVVVFVVVVVVFVVVFFIRDEGERRRRRRRRRRRSGLEGALPLRRLRRPLESPPSPPPRADYRDE